MQTSLYENQRSFWESAGKIGYDKAVFSDPTVARHILASHWNAALVIARRLGLTADASVLEMGCGDGRFARGFLAPAFRDVHAFDISEAAIERAKTEGRSSGIHFFTADASDLRFPSGTRWDGIFMIGFLHHIKPFVPRLLARVGELSSTVVVVEPNGDNWLRKGLELLPKYRRAGESSLTLSELRGLFEKNGFELVCREARTVIPPFLPGFLFPPLEKIERVVEASVFLRPLCSTRLLGFQKRVRARRTDDV